MPSVRHGDATIYYEELGRGFPILTFAPAGLQSTIDVWRRPAAPIDPTTELAASFRVIAMDQRNAGGRSHAPITARDGWHTYTGDHLALLDHLGIDRCHLYGSRSRRSWRDCSRRVTSSGSGRPSRPSPRRGRASPSSWPGTRPGHSGARR